jgi:hypothetical protein
VCERVIGAYATSPSSFDQFVSYLYLKALEEEKLIVYQKDSFLIAHLE